MNYGNSARQQQSGSGEEGFFSAKAKLTIGGALGLFTLIFVSSHTGNVPPGNLGIKVNKLTGTAEQVGVGYTWLFPSKDLFIFPTFKQNYTWTHSPHEGTPNDESITFQTSEGLEVNADFGISYTVAPDKVATLFQTYRKGVTEITDIYLRNYVRDAVNETATTMRVEDIYGKGKTELLTTVKQKVSAKVQPVGINVDEIYIVGSFRLPQNVMAALNAKLEAQQRAAQRENEVVEAKAQAEKEVAQANGQAQSLLAKARAESQAQALQRQTITPEIVRLRAIEKWDGRLPQIVGNGTMPMIDLKAAKAE